MRHMSMSRSATFLFLLSAAGLTSLVYFPGLSGDYVFDDFPNILQNQFLHLKSLDIDSLLSASLSSDAGALKRPISMLSFALNYYFFGIGPYSLKVTNLVIHVVNGVGLFILTYLLLSIPRSQNTLNISERQIPWISAIVAMIWMVHPINLTGVLYIVQRMASLSSLFTIYGIIFYVWYRTRLFHNEGKLFVLIAGSMLFLLFAVFSKENGALLPFYLLLIEIIIFRFKNSDGQTNTAVVVSFATFFIAPLLVLIVWITANFDVITAGYTNRGFTIDQRVLTELRILCTYLRMIFAPSITQLGIFHDDVEISQGVFDPPTTGLSMLFLAALLGVALSAVRRFPFLSLGILWFFTSHLMESSIIPLELMHEHRNYLASYGTILAAVVSLYLMLKHLNKHAASIPIAAAVILVLSALTFFRAQQWGSTVSLALSEAAHHPKSPRATYAAARLYVKLVLDGGEKKLLPEAMAQLDTAIAVGKHDIKPDIARLILASKLGIPIAHEWLMLLHDKLNSSPILVDEVTALASLNQCQREGCNIPNTEVVRLYLDALGNKYLRPHDRVHAHLFTAYADFSLNNLADRTLAEKLFRQAIAIDPSGPQFRINYAAFLIEAGRAKEARDQLAVLAKLNTLGDLSNITDDLTHRLASIGGKPQAEKNDNTKRLGIPPALGYDSP